MPPRYVLSIDAGTTGITVCLFERSGRVARKVYSEFPQIYPKPGWVEHDPDEIWRTTARLLAEISSGLAKGDIASVGITNQRETTVLWDRETGAPFGNAIVWQCRRTAPVCSVLKQKGREPLFRERTGLVLDAYFSGTKIAWILENVPAARKAADAGRAAFGTIDAWLIHRLTGGAVHATDPTNASRTLLYDIRKRAWDDELAAILGVPRSVLPAVKPSAGLFGVTADDGPLGGGVPIAGVAGDQQAALFGQGCVLPGSVKNTYGTGCFALVNCGTKHAASEHGLLTTLACGPTGEAVYALEGPIFIAGAVVQWLRDALGIIDSAAESEALAAEVEDTAGVYFVPAFVGLGAPYWDADARGAIVGLTRGSGRNHIVRAALESICYQTRDLIEVFSTDLPRGMTIAELAVDGGAVKNDLLMQMQADILGIPIVRPKNVETTAQGAAWLAGLGVGFWKTVADIESGREPDRRFEPAIDAAARDRLYEGWKAAVARARSR